MNRMPIVGITIGDPAGIGPELVAKALADPSVLEACRPLVIGTKELVGQGARFAGVALPIRAVEAFEDARFEDGVIDVLDLHNLSLEDVRLGVVDGKVGRAAVEHTLAALDLAMKEKIHAIASAPVNKSAMAAGGYHFQGQTELLAHYAGVQRFAMVLLVAGVFIFQYTTHMSLRDALDAIKRNEVYAAIAFAHASLKEFGYERPRIGVAGVNPHCGEGGKFGWEDINEIAPAVERARLEGIDVKGPISPDALFIHARDGTYDAAIAMYHDQANIAAKLMGDAVTVVAGLPVVRTSVVHGTAHDIAGKGIADPGMMKMAITTAAGLAARKHGLTCVG